MYRRPIRSSDAPLGGAPPVKIGIVSWRLACARDYCHLETCACFLWNIYFSRILTFLPHTYVRSLPFLTLTSPLLHKAHVGHQRYRIQVTVWICMHPQASDCHHDTLFQSSLFNLVNEGWCSLACEDGTCGCFMPTSSITLSAGMQVSCLADCKRTSKHSLSKFTRRCLSFSHQARSPQHTIPNAVVLYS